MSEAKELAFSKAAVTKLVIEEIRKIAKDEIMAFFMHTNEFLRISREKRPVFSQSHYEDTHLGDESGADHEMMKQADETVKKYLPDDFSIFTRTENKSLENLRQRRITPDTCSCLAEERTGIAIVKTLRYRTSKDTGSVRVKVPTSQPAMKSKPHAK